MIEFSFSGDKYHTGRLIGERVGGEGPTVLFFGGIHGNEPTGVIALIEVFAELEKADVCLNGTLIGVAGNLAALKINERFIDEDLNRIWSRDFESRLEELKNGNCEQKEQADIFEIVEPLLKKGAHPTYFVDLHTTSSNSLPFIAINDQLDNRHFADHFSVPKILGIEEYLEGPLLSYLNDVGHVALAFEAGQHDDPESIQTHKSFVYLAMARAGVVAQDDIPNLEDHRNRIANSGLDLSGFFEVIFRKPVTDGDQFMMNPGYRNFSPIKKGEPLARDRNGTINAHRRGRIFMPLYQTTGEDGFFLVKEVPKWALKLSAFLRTFNFDNLLLILPGVKRSATQSDALVVDKSVARFLANDIFHLLGYRRKKDSSTEMVYSRREIQ